MRFSTHTTPRKSQVNLKSGLIDYPLIYPQEDKFIQSTRPRQISHALGCKHVLFYKFCDHLQVQADAKLVFCSELAPFGDPKCVGWISEGLQRGQNVVKTYNTKPQSLIPHSSALISPSDQPFSISHLTTDIFHLVLHFYCCDPFFCFGLLPL